MIAVKNLHLYRDKRLILDINDFELVKGETIAIIGANGAGKSTLLKVLALLEQPSAGAVFFNNQKVTPKNVLALRRMMAVVFQEPLLLNTTVFDNVAQGLYLRGFKKSEVKDRVNEWLEKLGIYGLSNRRPVYLSGGEAQRVSLARAFVLEPEVVFLDEPFSALDFPTRVDLLDKLGSLLSSTDTTAVFVTHDFTEIPYLTQRVFVIDRGSIIYSGNINELLGGQVKIKAVESLLSPLYKAQKLKLFGS